MSKTIIGVTGPSNGGKSTFCKVFESSGYTHINADEIYHFLLNGGVYDAKLLEAFGEGIFKEGAVCRKELAKIVFSDKEKLKVLGEITHKKVDDEIKRRVDISNRVVLDIPLLYESGVDFSCDEIFAVLAPEKTLIKRAMMRDNISEEAAIKRIQNQKNVKFYEKCGATIINNDKSEREFIEKVKEIVEKYELKKD